MAKAKQNKAGKKDSPGPLQKSFEKKKAGSPRKAIAAAAPAASSQQVPSREQNSLFLSYVKSAMNCKSAETAAQAAQVNAYYRTLSLSQKKDVILQFFRAGGKKSGLSSCYTQSLLCEQKATDVEWSGYATLGMLLDFLKVIVELSPPSKRFGTTSCSTLWRVL